MCGKTNSTIKARSRGLLRACCYFEFPVVVKGAKFFVCLRQQKFSAQVLDKTGVRCILTCLTRCRHRTGNIYDAPSFEACWNTPNTLLFPSGANVRIFTTRGRQKTRAGKRKAAPLAQRVKSKISRAGVPRRAAFLVQRDRSTL